MNWSDPETDIIQSIIDFCAESKQRHEELMRNPPRLCVPAYLVEGWSQEKLDAYWVEAV